MSAWTDDLWVLPSRSEAPVPALLVARLAARLVTPWAPLARRLGGWALGLVLPALLLGLWWLAAERRWVPEQLLPAPALVAQTLHELWDAGDLQAHLGYSAARVGWSLLIGGAAGLLLGFGMGLSRGLRAYLYPSFSVLAQFPVLGWVPLLIIFAGIDEALKISAISIAVGVPVTVNALKGIANIPPPLLEVARVHGFSRWQALRQVVLPAAAPSLFTGLRQAVMQAWLSLVFVELLASSEGIGYLIVWGRQLSQPDLVVAGMLVIAAVGVLLDMALRAAEARLQRWRRSPF
ncbi:ABC transporter permease [Ideonella sp. YS5]|uniref:ABC transporter permease n=1 Tax=Ideonella sp. YS5 TaxID=3453714 RepID=UPI003EEBD4E1